MEIVGPFLIGFPSLIVITVLIIRYKLKNKELEMRGSDPQLGPEVDTLRDDLNNTRAQLAEIQERLDFTERLLAGGRASQRGDKCVTPPLPRLRKPLDPAIIERLP